MDRHWLRIGMIAFLVCFAAQGIWAGGDDDSSDDSSSESEVPFDEAELYFELNDTDKDLGIHGSIDGGPWTKLEIENPGERRLLSIRTSGSLRRQGMTQLFFESAEPTLDEVSAGRFFGRFSEGTYEISGISTDREELENDVEVTQVMADRPRNVKVAGIPAAESCDADSLPEVSAPVVITWDPVTMYHPEIGKPGPIEIVRYQFFVERDNVKLSVDLPPEVTEFQVPAEILALGDEFKFEIIAREASGNNTAVESCFILD